MESNQDIVSMETLEARITKASTGYDEVELMEWKRWGDKWASLNWIDPKE